MKAMVKVPIGERVVVNLWNNKSKHGMIKYYHNTMDIVRAESEFDLSMGDAAIVTESFDSFCVVVPEDKYTKLIDDFEFRQFKLQKFAQVIWEILKEREIETGGILTLEEMHSIFKRTSIQAFISDKLMKKLLKLPNAPYDHVKFDKKLYFVLKPSEVVKDKQILIELAQSRAYLTIDFIQAQTSWHDLRIHRMLEYLVDEKRIRKEDSYRTGARYYFINV